MVAVKNALDQNTLKQENKRLREAVAGHEDDRVEPAYERR